MKKRTPARSESTGTTPPRRRRRIAEGVLVFAGCMLLIDGLFGEKGLVAMRKANREEERYMRQLQQLTIEAQELRAEMYRLRDDPAAIEDLARTKFGLIKPGEKLFVVKDPTPAAAQSPASPSPAPSAPAPQP